MYALTLMMFAGVFEGEDYQDVAVSSYTQSLDPLSKPSGLQIKVQRLIETQNVSTSPTGERASLSLWRNAEGEVQLDELEVRSLLFSLRSRPHLGETLDIGLLVGDWDEVVAHGQGKNTQWLVYTPIALHLLGLARNDMDADDRLKYYTGASGGIGGEATLQLAGPAGLHTRGETRLSSKNRWRNNDVNTTRHELEVEVDLGMSWRQKNRQWIVSAWGERLWRWDPRDDLGRNGVDRQHESTGLRLTVRRYKANSSLELEPDLDAVLKRLRKGIEPSDPHADLEHLAPNPPIPLDAIAETQAMVSKTLSRRSPLLVHWSEPEILKHFQPVLPEGVTEQNATCKLRFFIDSEGRPYEIKPEACAAPLLGPAMAAAWQWRLAPFAERGEIHPIQFLYSVRWQKSQGVP